MTDSERIIEIVGYRRGHVFRVEIESVALGIRLINRAVDDGAWAGVGVFIDGQPRAVSRGTMDDEPHEPTPKEAEQMRCDYAQAHPEEWF